MISATDSSSHTSTYTYDGEGARVRRNINGQETWQVYGLDGELTAEYAANGAAANPQKEYGYRNGQLLVTAEAGSGSGGGGQNVSWTNAVGVSVSGNSLTKTAADGWGNSGASSTQTINSGDGYVEFTATETNTARMCGLNHSDPDQNYGIGFALGVWPGGTLYLFEAGSYSVLGSYATGDRLKVAVESGVVKYYQNGQLIHTSGTAPTYPLLADTAFYSNGGTITNAVFSNGGGGASIHWLVTDQLGTPRMIFDQTGSLATVSRHDYLPFGEELFAGQGSRTQARGYTLSDNVRQKFTGYEQDGETGLEFAQARYHATMQGRFTSPDPGMAGADAIEPQSWNGYSYVGNNPLNRVDPLGLYFVGGGTAETNLQDPQKLPPDWPMTPVDRKDVIITKINLDQESGRYMSDGEAEAKKLRNSLGTGIADEFDSRASGAAPQGGGGFGFGTILSGTAAAGIGAGGVGATGSGFCGKFFNGGRSTSGCGAQGGAQAYLVTPGARAATPRPMLSAVPISDDEHAAIIGASADVGIGLFLTNAKDVTELKGPFHTKQLNTPFFSAQYDESNGVRVFSFTVGPGIGASYYGGNTSTKTTRPFLGPMDLRSWQK